MSVQRKRIMVTIVFVVALSLLLLACSPRSLETGSESSGSEGGGELVAAEFTWTPDSNCAQCHEKSTASLATLACEAAHASNPDDTCMTCHTDAAGIETAHAEVTLADTAGDINALRKSKVSEDACLSCHSLEEIIAATSTSTALTDTEGLTVNPHEVSTVYNVSNNHKTVTCSSCHKMHSEVSVAENASLYCRSCHHQGVFACGTCHE